MGMSSSQARLLTLTGRLHSIERKAQKLEAEKLRLANDSDRVYENYLRKLDATKIQYRALQNDGSITYKDATLNAMENGIIGNWNGETSNTTLFLQDVDGKVLVTPAVAAKYGLSSTADETRDLDTFVKETTGKDKTPRKVTRQEAVIEPEEIMESVEVPDENTILDFTKIPNQITSLPVNDVSHTYSPIDNIEGGIDYSALKDYAEFQDSHTTSTTGATEINSSTDTLTAGGTYVISDAEGLKKLSELATATNTSGSIFILSNDIDMSGVSNWSGISNFAGTFDGNGYKITNLSGTNGLFASTKGATVKNVGLENININGNSSYVGGLIGYAVNTNIDNCYTTGTVKNSDNTSDTPVYTATSGSISAGTGGLVGGTYVQSGKTVNYNNIYSSANVSGGNSTGGLLGSTWVTYASSVFNLTNCYAIGSVSGLTNVGGLAGRMWYDEDNSGDITDIKNAYAGGNVTGQENVGGFCGDFLYWGDNSDKCYLYDCMAVGKITSADSTSTGGFIGKLHIKNASSGGDDYIVHIVNCGFAENNGAANGYGMVEDTQDPGTDVRDVYMSNSGSAGSLITFKLAGSIPSIESDGTGDYMQNIIAALIKADAYDPCEGTDNEMETKIKNFLKSFNDNDTDNTKLWYLNTAINEYLNGTGSEGLGAALAQDITNGTKTATSVYQQGAALDGSVKRAADTNINDYTGTHNVNKGEVTIPSISDIGDSLFYALKKAGYTVEQSDVKTWINNNYSTSSAEDKMYLANLNDDIQNGTNLRLIANAITANSQYVNSSNYATENWNITLNSTQGVTPTYGTTTIEQGTGDYKDKIIGYQDVFDHYEYYWDTTDSDIANAIAMYAMAKRGVTVVTDAQASSYTWLNNMIEAGEAVFTTFDPSQVEVFSNMSETEINNMSDAEYEDLMGIKNTSVSVETSLQEVSDEVGLKKAEAEYEADMKKIDRKDARYDTEIAKLETERTAVVDEMDTLKTVAKDNVERTFKLFS